MKQITFLLLAMLLLMVSCKSTSPASSSSISSTEGTKQVGETAKPFDYHQQSSMVLGYFDVSELKREPHAEWFNKGYDEYMPSSSALNSLLEISNDGLTIKIVMGTWCPDSRREVPRMMKILDLWQFPSGKITFIGVDVAKQSPVSEMESLSIQRVPTFIFYKNNIEAGRIIEVPKTSLEQDMVNILQGTK